MSYGLEPSLMCLDFESTGWSGNVYRLLTKRTRKIIFTRDVKFDETWLGFGNLRNKDEPLYVYDNYDADGGEEKKDAQAPTEAVKDSTGENLHSRKQKKCNLCWDHVLGLEQKKMPRRKKSQRTSPRKLIQFLLASKDIRIPNLLENPVKNLRAFQDSVEPRETLLSLPQAWFSRR